MDTKITFEYGYYVDPLAFGDYPQIMKDLVTDDRLPTFTEEEKAMLIGTFDYIGVNYYYSRYIHETGVVGRDWGSDPRVADSHTDMYGHVIGPSAASSWLTIYPEGLRGLLNWLDKRYSSPKIYIFENGVSVPGESQAPVEKAVHDQFRVDFYYNHTKAVIEAIYEDGVDVQAYFAWALIDNFEWTNGLGTRFGMIYVDYKNNLTRHVKDSAYWYSQLIQNTTQPASCKQSVSLQLEFEDPAFEKEEKFLYMTD